MGLHVRAVSVFGKKSDAVCGLLAYFCAVLRFSDPPYAPLLTVKELYCDAENTIKTSLFLVVKLVELHDIKN